MDGLLLYLFAVRFGALHDLSELFQGWGHGIIGVEWQGIIILFGRLATSSMSKPQSWNLILAHPLAGCSKWNVFGQVGNNGDNHSLQQER